MKKTNPLFLLLFLILVGSCHSGTELLNKGQRFSEKSYKGDDIGNEKADPTIVQLISPYKKEVDGIMNEVIGQCKKELTKEAPESTLGNWFADLQHQKSEEYYKEKIDFCVVNYGSIRIPSLPKGDLTVGKLFELMPFDNKVVVVKVKGNIVRQLFQRMMEAGGWPISKAVHFEAVDGRLQTIKINGEELKDDKIYKISMADYVANGGDKCFFFKDQERENLNVLVRDIIIEYVKEQTAKGELLDANIEGRTSIR